MSTEGFNWKKLEISDNDVKRNKGEIFFNATDLLNTKVIKKSIQGATFNYTSDNYYETQIIRLGYTYKF